MKTILVGTTNPAKAMYFQDLLKDEDAKFVTLGELGIADEPQETGHTPEENARIKAAFYGRYAEYVVCAVSGLFGRIQFLRKTIVKSYNHIETSVYKNRGGRQPAPCKEGMKEQKKAINRGGTQRLFLNCH